MAYEPQTWADGEAGGTPITAARLNHIESGIVSVDESIPTVPAAPTVDTLSGATATGRAVMKSADAAAARTAIGAGTSSQNLATGTAAQLEAGTDTTASAWTAKAIADEIARQIAAAATPEV